MTLGNSPLECPAHKNRNEKKNKIEEIFYIMYTNMLLDNGNKATFQKSDSIIFIHSKLFFN